MDSSRVFGFAVPACAIVFLLSFAAGCSVKIRSDEQGLVRLLRDSNVSVMSVRRSAKGSLFDDDPKAAWIETDRGVLDAVFFDKPSRAEGIRVSEIQKGEPGRYRYHVQERPGMQPQLVDSDRPLYFTIHGSMFLVTDSMELNETLKRILKSRD